MNTTTARIKRIVASVSEAKRSINCIEALDLEVFSISIAGLWARKDTGKEVMIINAPVPLSSPIGKNHLRATTNDDYGAETFRETGGSEVCIEYGESVEGGPDKHGQTSLEDTAETLDL